MKVSGSCSKCACTKLYVVDEVRQPAHDSPNGIVPLTVTTLAVPAPDLGLRDSNTYRAAVGHFEAWVCSSCGFTEWYAQEFGPAFELALKLTQRVHVRIVERAAGEPYR